MWIVVWSSSWAVTATCCACGAITATLCRTRGSTGEAVVTGPAAGRLVPEKLTDGAARKLTDGRQEAPKREAQFSSGFMAELMLVTAGTSLQERR